jgi:hypothetical protein
MGRSLVKELGLNGRETLDSGEAEARARQFIKQRHSRVERIFFRTMHREGDAWVLQGEMKFKRAYFFVTVRSLKVQVNTNTGEVTSYEEANLQNAKKQGQEKSL